MARKTKDWITTYLRYTEESEPARLYREWTAISVVAAVLQRKCFLPWGPGITWYPNMYVVLVGPSGKARKGTAMSMGAQFLREVGVKMSAEAITREALIRELKETQDHFELPGGKMELHASLTIFSQELTVFLGYNNLQLISDITDWYDCRSLWTYRTKNQGTDDIIGVWVNLMGATTPELIQSALPIDAVGGGLTSRIIFVYEEDKEKLVPAPFITPEMISLRKDLLDDLEYLYSKKGMYLVSEDFIEEYSKWYVESDGNPPFSHPNFSGYLSRRPNHVMKLSMILAASEESVTEDGSMILTKEILLRAVDLIKRTEVKMPRTFMGYGGGNFGSIGVKIMEFIKRKGSTTRREIMQTFYGDIGTVQNLDAILDSIYSLGVAREVTTEDKTKINYRPNQYI